MDYLKILGVYKDGTLLLSCSFSSGNAKRKEEYFRRMMHFGVDGSVRVISFMIMLDKE